MKRKKDMVNIKGDRQGTGTHICPPRACEAAQMAYSRGDGGLEGPGAEGRGGEGEAGARRKVQGRRPDPCWAGELCSREARGHPACR